MDDRRFEELAAEHMLGRLEEEEAAEFAAERARRGASGEAAIRRLGETLGALALAAPTEAPPAALRDRVLDAALREGRRVEPISRRAWPWMAVAAVVAALAVGLAAWALALQAERGRLRAELEATRGRLAAADSAARARAQELAILASPEARAVALTGTDALPGARARVFVDPATGRAILYAYDLPILPPGTVYELWAIRGGIPQAAGTFRPDDRGRARLEIARASGLEEVDALAVTVEPAPGGPAPTGEMVLISES